MTRLLARILTAVQLTRLTIAFGAVSDIWFVILLARAGAEGTLAPPLEFPAEGDVSTMPILAALAAGAIVAVGLFAYGASLNDLLDVRHDAAFTPERPIPSGRIRFGQAVVVAVGSLIVAVLGGVWIGTWSVCLTLLVAATLLFYDATGKYIPAVAIVTVGLAHAGHMFIPSPDLRFTLPVWLVMTHAMAVAAAVHILEDKRPRLDQRAIAATIAGWIFWSAVVVGLPLVGGARAWPEDRPAIALLLPGLVAASFALVAWWKARRVPSRAAAEKVRRYGAMWQSLYGAAWLAALGLRTEAIWIGLFACCGFVAMTLIKEVTGLSGRPLAYRL